MLHILFHSFLQLPFKIPQVPSLKDQALGVRLKLRLRIPQTHPPPSSQLPSSWQLWLQRLAAALGPAAQAGRRTLTTWQNTKCLDWGFHSGMSNAAMMWSWLLTALHAMSCPGSMLVLKPHCLPGSLNNTFQTAWTMGSSTPLRHRRWGWAALGRWDLHHLRPLAQARGRSKNPTFNYQYHIFWTSPKVALQSLQKWKATKSWGW